MWFQSNINSQILIIEMSVFDDINNTQMWSENDKRKRVIGRKGKMLLHPLVLFPSLSLTCFSQNSIILFSNVPWPYSVSKGFCYNLHQTALKWPLRQYSAPKILRNKSWHNLSTVLSSPHTLVRCWRNKEKPGVEESQALETFIPRLRLSELA